MNMHGGKDGERCLEGEREQEQTQALCTDIILISEGQSNLSNMTALAVTSVKSAEWQPCLFHDQKTSYYI